MTESANVFSMFDLLGMQERFENYMASLRMPTFTSILMVRSGEETYNVGDTCLLRHMFTSAEVAAFAVLVQDPNGPHTNVIAAKRSVFGRIVVEGMYTLSLVTAILGSQYPGEGCVLVGLDEVKWRAPVHPGEEVLIKLELVETKPATEGRAAKGIFSFIYTVGETKVLTGRVTTTLP